MNLYYSRLIDHKLNQLLVLKRMIAAKVVTLTPQNTNKLENHQKFMKVLKKQCKEHKSNDFDFSFLCQGFMEEHDQFIRLCYWNFRLQKTDFQALFTKLKFTQQPNKKAKISLQEIINFQRKKQGDIIMNSKSTMLNQLRNQVQDFDLNTLLNKAMQVLLNLPISTSFSEERVMSLSAIVRQICKGYHIMPFHSFTHGFQVFISFNFLCQNQNVLSLMDSFSTLFWHLACLAHDIHHQGVNTLFEVKTNSELSNQFGKFVVLEKMHLSKTLQILIKKQSTNKLYESLTKEEKTRARRIIAKAILATDMSKHYDYVALVSQKTSIQTPEDKQIILQTLVHACDIQNPSLDFQNYMYWAHLVCIEFHDQTLREKQLNVQITDFLKFDSLPYFYKNQMNFANTIVLPLWQALQTLFPEIRAREYTSRIKKNISILNEAVRRNSEPIILHRQFQQYISNQLQN